MNDYFTRSDFISECERISKIPKWLIKPYAILLILGIKTLRIMKKTVGWLYEK